MSYYQGGNNLELLENDQDNLDFEPMVFEEELYEKEQLQFTDPNSRPIQIAIDDYFDPESKIKISKKQKKMDTVFDEIKALKKVVKKKKQKQAKKYKGELPAKRAPKKKKLVSTEAHIKGGWNTDVRTVGVFDPNLNKGELEERRKQRKMPKKYKKEAQLPEKKELKFEVFFYEINLLDTSVLY